MQLQDKIVNFLGDSITEGVGVSSEGHIFLNVIKERYHLKKANNYGIGGTRIAKQHKPTVDNPHHDLYFASRIPDMDGDADIIVVFGGTNDYGHGDAPIGQFSDRTPDTFYGACHDLYTRLIEKYPGKPIVIMTPLHRTDEEGHGDPDMVENLPLVGYVDIIKEVARYYSLPVCDLFANSGIQPNVPILLEKFVPDGLHPNDAGQQIIAERLGNFLMSL